MPLGAEASSGGLLPPSPWWLPAPSSFVAAGCLFPGGWPLAAFSLVGFGLSFGRRLASGLCDVVWPCLFSAGVFLSLSGPFAARGPAALPPARVPLALSPSLPLLALSPSLPSLSPSFLSFRDGRCRVSLVPSVF